MGRVRADRERYADGVTLEDAAQRLSRALGQPVRAQTVRYVGTHYLNLAFGAVEVERVQRLTVDAIHEDDLAALERFMRDWIAVRGQVAVPDAAE